MKLGMWSVDRESLKRDGLVLFSKLIRTKNVENFQEQARPHIGDDRKQKLAVSLLGFVICYIDMLYRISDTKNLRSSILRVQQVKLLLQPLCTYIQKFIVCALQLLLDIKLQQVHTSEELLCMYIKKRKHVFLSIVMNQKAFKISSVGTYFQPQLV